MKLSEIAQFLSGAEIEGDKSIEISGINNIFEAEEGEITFLTKSKYADKLPLCQASAVIVSKEVKSPGLNLLKVENPRFSFGKLMALFVPKKIENGEVSENTYISKTSIIRENVTVYPNAYIGDYTEIGKNTVIYSGCFVGDRVEIGEDCYLYANSVIQDGSILKSRVIVNAGSVVGSEGYGFERDGDQHIKIPQIGKVILEEDVEIGTLCAVDRGSMQDTVIGKGSKLDNFVHIAHNVKIGENNLFLAQVNIAGSTETGKNVYFGGRAGCMDHLKIIDRTMIGPGAVITNDVTKTDVLYGYPARPYKEWSKATALFYKMDEQRKKTQSMEKRIKELEEIETHKKTVK